MVKILSQIQMDTEITMAYLAEQIGQTQICFSLCMSLQWVGAAISGVVSGKLIEYGILTKTWLFKGLTLSNYDTLILFSSVIGLTRPQIYDRLIRKTGGVLFF